MYVLKLVERNYGGWSVVKLYLDFYSRSLNFSLVTTYNDYVSMVSQFYFE